MIVTAGTNLMGTSAAEGGLGAARPFLNASLEDTESCRSAITFLDVARGIPRSRGGPVGDWP